MRALTLEEQEGLVAYMRTPEGRKTFRVAIQQGFAYAADHMPPSSVAESICRAYAGLPVKLPRGRLQFSLLRRARLHSGD